MKLRNLFPLLVGALLISIIAGGCGSSSPDNILSGTITFNEFTEVEDCALYIFLDNDTDITNGYQKRTIISYSSPPSSPIEYEIDTAAVPGGSGESYYLLGAIDWGEDNMDPDDPQVWEMKGWYGSGTSSPPWMANVTDLSGEYDFTLYGLG